MISKLWNTFHDTIPSQSTVNIFAKNDIYRQLFTQTFITRNDAKFISTKWLANYKNPKPQKKTDALDGKLIPLDELWNELIAKGMRDPFILRYCPNLSTLRLETGNQRIVLFETNHIHWIPTVLESATTPIGSTANGCHYYPAPL